MRRALGGIQLAGILAFVYYVLGHDMDPKWKTIALLAAIFGMVSAFEKLDWRRASPSGSDEP